MVVTVESEENITTVTAESAESPLVIIQMFAGRIAPDTLRAGIPLSFREDLESRGAKILKDNGQPVTRKIFGQQQRGELVSYQLVGQKFRTEWYVVLKEKAVIAIMLQHEVQEAALAKKYLSRIIDSLE